MLINIGRIPIKYNSLSFQEIRNCAGIILMKPYNEERIQEKLGYQSHLNLEERQPKRGH